MGSAPANIQSVWNAYFTLAHKSVILHTTDGADWECHSPIWKSESSTLPVFTHPLVETWVFILNDRKADERNIVKTWEICFWKDKTAIQGFSG